MKTPRQIIFERHRSIETRLDTIRKNALAEISHIKKQGCEEEAPFASWRELFHFLRWHLAGMSAVWFFVLILNSESSPAVMATITKENSATPQQFVMALRENRRQIAELTQLPHSEPVSIPQTFVPPRRSEFLSPSEMA